MEKTPLNREFCCSVGMLNGIVAISQLLPKTDTYIFFGLFIYSMTVYTKVLKYMLIHNIIHHNYNYLQSLKLLFVNYVYVLNKVTVLMTMKCFTYNAFLINIFHDYLLSDSLL